MGTVFFSGIRIPCSLRSPTWGGSVEVYGESSEGAKKSSFRRSKHRIRLVAERRKPGRSPDPLCKGGDRTKNKKLSIRISEEDLRAIHEKSSKAKKNLTDYVTDCCLGKQIVVIDGLPEVVKQQKAIGRNLNQLVTLANMGRVQVVYLKELTEQYAQANDLLAAILKRKRWDDGAG